MLAGPVRPLIIEFFGLSGAGKTTLARACVDRLRAIYPFVYSKPDLWDKTPWRKLLPRIRTIIDEWSTAWPTMRLDFGSPSLPRHPGELTVIYRLRAMLNAPYYLVAVKRMADSNPHGIIVLDGWLVMNRIWGPCRLAECQVRKTSQLLTYFESQFNFVVVMLNMDSEEAAKRAYKRGIQRRAGTLDGWSRFDALEQWETAAYLKRRNACLQCVRQRYATKGRRVYELNADLPIQANVDRVMNEIFLPYIASTRWHDVGHPGTGEQGVSTPCHRKPGGAVI